MSICDAFSYKENESNAETDSDEVVEAAADTWNGVEDDGTEAIEKIMDVRVIIMRDTFLLN